MIHRNVVLVSAALALLSSTSAFAARNETAEAPRHAVHRHHVAKNASPKTVSDVDRDAGMYVVKPQSEPEYFGHASGSDGSIPAE